MDNYKKFEKEGIYVNVFPYWDWLRSEIKFAYDALSTAAGRGNYSIPVYYSDSNDRKEVELLAFEAAQQLVDSKHKQLFTLNSHKREYSVHPFTDEQARQYEFDTLRQENEELRKELNLRKSCVD